MFEFVAQASACGGPLQSQTLQAEACATKTIAEFELVATRQRLDF